MRFKDAAYEILKSSNKPLHYNAITDQAITAGLLETTGQTPINGIQLTDLLFQYKVGVKQEERIIHSIDTEYWTEVLGISLDESEIPEEKKSRKSKIKFPLAIEAQHRGKIYIGELLDLQGSVRIKGKKYAKPSIAAKTIATDWQQVNGWKFWKYENPETEEWEYISNLREVT